MLNYFFTKTPLVFLVQSFWRDEGFSYLMAKKSIFQILISTARDFSPPFYYLTLHYWMKIFGSSEISIRSLSLIFYWATLYVVFLFLKDIFKFSLKKSWFYLLIFILNPLLAYYAFEGRMYSMFAFFATLSFYSLYKKNSKLYILSSIFGLYTHYFMILVVAAQYLFSKFKQINILLGFLPWMIFVLTQKEFPAGSFWIKKPVLANIFTFLGQIYSGFDFELKKINLVTVFIFILIPLLTCIGVYLFKKEKKMEKKLFNYLFLWAVYIPLFVLFISFIKPLFIARYLIFSTVGLILLLILIIEKFPRLLRIIIIIAIITLSFLYQKFEIKERQKTNMRKPLSEIKSLMKLGDFLYVTSELDYFTATYYLDENKVFIYGKRYEEIPYYIGKTLLPKEKVISSLPYYPHKAFILDSWGDYIIQATY